MNLPIVSVVVPVYNGERFLAQALQSIVDRQGLEAEIIVVDDGSTDGSAGVAANFPVTLVRQANAGQSMARNAGVALARGEYLAFLDQDDWWLPGKLRAQLDLLESQPGDVLALCQMRYHLEGPPPATFRALDLDRAETGYVPGAWLLRRSLFERVGGFDPSFRRAEDIDWLARAKDAGVREVVVPRHLLWKRVHGHNQSDAPAEAHREVIAALRASARRQTGQARDG